MRDNAMNPTHLQLTPAPTDRDNAVWIYFGLAAYYAQNLERGVLQLVAMLEFAGLSSLGGGTVEQVFARLNAQTMGQLLRAARQKIQILATLDPLLAESLEERNFLFHRFFHHHALDHINEAGRAMMVDRLQRMAMLFKRTDMELTNLFVPLAASIGISEQMMEAEYRQLLQEYEDNPGPS